FRSSHSLFAIRKQISQFASDFRNQETDFAARIRFSQSGNAFRSLKWTPKTGQGPKVENRCLKEKTWDSGRNSRQDSKPRSRWRRSKPNGQRRNWGHFTAFIRRRSQPGKSSWWRKLPKSSLAAAFTITRPSSKKERNCISRSESCRWNWTGF